MQKRIATKREKNVPSYPLTIIFRRTKWRCIQNAMISVTVSHTVMYWDLFDVNETRKKGDILQIIYRRMNLNYDRAMRHPSLVFGCKQQTTKKNQQTTFWSRKKNQLVFQITNRANNGGAYGSWAIQDAIVTMNYLFWLQWHPCHASSGKSERKQRSTTEKRRVEAKKSETRSEDETKIQLRIQFDSNADEKEMMQEPEIVLISNDFKFMPISVIRWYKSRFNFGFMPEKWNEFSSVFFLLNVEKKSCVFSLVI